ncbi:MAG: glutamate ligase domain-containing protein, partial [Clostridia bacterium]
PHGIRGTAESLAHHFPGRKAIVILGIMADKDVDAMLESLLPLVQKAYTVRPENPRAMDPGLLADKIASRGVPAQACASVEDGVRAAFAHASKDDIICAIGSFYMYGDIADAVEKIAPC